jgi:protein-tyrosine-phosphatase
MKHVLFVCTHNAGRSQMAQAFFEIHGPDDVRAESAGTDPRSEVWPDVVTAMKEVGIDLSGRRPKRLDLEMQLHADWAVTMGCGDSCPYVATRVEDWDLPDPAGQPLERVLQIRDQIEQKVLELIETRIDDIRTDPTAHQLRIQRLLPQLHERFSATHSPDEIRACIDQVLSQFRTPQFARSSSRLRAATRPSACAMARPAAR